jgi:hypothetical protein
MGQSATSEIPGENAHSQSSAAQGAAVERENAPIDPDLEAIIVRWSGLPEAIKSEILRMVNAQSAS